eukprot:SM000345S12837  [mRNA]  locus=s345:90936:92480:+ [translate_table: standard]
MDAADSFPSPRRPGGPGSAECRPSCHPAQRVSRPLQALLHSGSAGDAAPDDETGVAAEATGHRPESIASIARRTTGPDSRFPLHLLKALRALAAPLSVVVMLACLVGRPVPAWASAAHGTVVLEEGGGVLASAWTGLAAGCLHTLTGPDHLAALAPLSIGRSRLQSAAIGVLWGLGHDAGQLLFGALFIALKERLRMELVKSWGTRVVGLTLLAIGAMGVKEAREPVIPCVEGDEDCVAEYAAAGAGSAPAARSRVGPKKAFGTATFVTGVVHGLQPDALLMVLPALALPSKLASAAFLVMFLLGTIAAMGTYTACIGSLTEAMQDRLPGITQRLSWISALAAIVFGALILLSDLLGWHLF